MPTNLSNLTKPKRGRRRSGFSWLRLSNRIKMLSFVAVFAVVGSAYLLYSHAATSPIGSIPMIALGDTNVTDADAMYPDDPVASSPATTESTLYNLDLSLAADSVSCSQFTVLNRIVHDSSGNNYDLNNNRYGGGAQCARNTDGGADFTVYDGGTGTANGGVSAYPNLIRGCSNQKCYSNNWPIKESSLGYWGATASMDSNNASGTWNANYDIWFNRSNSIGPSRGTEILIDWNRKNRSRPTGGTHFTNVLTAAGSTWDLYFWRQSAVINNTKYTWNFLHYWRNSETYSTSNMSLNNFWDKATTITCPNGSACLHKDWYLTGIDTGFEIWTGGINLHMHGVKIQ